MDALAKLRYLTLHYRDLQGYRLLPFAAFFLAGAVHDFWAGFAFARYDGDNTWLMVNGLALLTLLFSAPFFSMNIGRWYERRYGYVAPPPPPKHRYRMLLWVLVFLAILTFQPLGENALIVAGLVMTVERLWRTLPDVRHIPQSVLWIAFGLNIPGLETGMVAYPPPGLNSAVIADLTAATLLFLTAVYNHRTLEQLSAAREVVPEEVP